MHIYSLSFLYLFLPVGLLLYHLLERRWGLKNAVLLGLGLFFYALIDLHNLPLLLIFLSSDYLFYRLMRRYREQPEVRRSFFIGSLIKSGAFLLISLWLYAMGRISLPFGLLIYTFSSMDLICCVYLEEWTDPIPPVDFFLFSSLFFRLYAGPFCAPAALLDQLRSRTSSVSKTMEGLRLFLCGLTKKVLLADQLHLLYTQLTPTAMFQLSFFGAWARLFVSIFSLLLYLSAYCDMARGLGLVFGFELPRNMFYPLGAKSFSEFISRFNHSVTALFRRRICTPIRQKNMGRTADLFCTMLACILLGVWFGITVNHLLWGAFLGLMVWLERSWWAKHLSKLPSLFQWLYAGPLILLSFSLFTTSALPEFGGFLQALFVGNHLPGNTQLSYLFSTNAVLPIAAVVLSLGLFYPVRRFLQRRLPKTIPVLGNLGGVLLLVVATAYLL